MQALQSDAPLIAYIDIKSPYAFIAVRPTRALGRALGINIDWRPFTLDIPSYLGSARLDARGKVVEHNRSASQWSGVKYAYRDARRYAALTGLTLRGTEKIWDTRLVNIALLWARERGEAAVAAFLDQVYPPFWRRELDVEDIDVVQAALDAAGIGRAGFHQWAEGAGGTLHDQLQAEAFAAGVFGVPTYVVGGEMFFGREHLPMVRWLLSGREGPAPDVANCSMGEP